MEVTDMFTILTVMMILQVYTYVKTYQIVHFKCIQSIMCQLYLKIVFNIIHTKLIQLLDFRKSRYLKLEKCGQYSRHKKRHANSSV